SAPATVCGATLAQTSPALFLPEGMRDRLDRSSVAFPADFGAGRAKYTRTKLRSRCPFQRRTPALALVQPHTETELFSRKGPRLLSRAHETSAPLRANAGKMREK